MNKTILLGLALAASVSAANAYHVEKYDGQFGMSLEGAYGIATKDAMPNVAGGNLSIFNYIETGSIVPPDFPERRHSGPAPTIPAFTTWASAAPTPPASVPRTFR